MRRRSGFVTSVALVRLLVVPGRRWTSFIVRCITSDYAVLVTSDRPVSYVVDGLV